MPALCLPDGEAVLCDSWSIAAHAAHHGGLAPVPAALQTLLDRDMAPVLSRFRAGYTKWAKEE